MIKRNFKKIIREIGNKNNFKIIIINKISKKINNSIINQTFKIINLIIIIIVVVDFKEEIVILIAIIIEIISRIRNSTKISINKIIDFNNIDY
jgi:hypothetical protein